MKKLNTLLTFLFMLFTVSLFSSCIPFSSNTDITTNSLTNSGTEDEIQYDISYKNVASWINSIGTMRIQVIAEITNTGSTPIYLSSSSYDLEDSNGQIIASKQYISTYPDVINSGEKGYLYDETSLDNIAHGHQQLHWYCG